MAAYMHPPECTDFEGTAHCWIHHTDEVIPRNVYRICFECGHVWTRFKLWRTYNRESWRLSGKPRWPSRVRWTSPSWAARTRTSMAEPSLTTSGRLVSMWGQMGVMHHAWTSGVRIGPPAEML